MNLNINNFRELSGYTNKDGKTIKSGKIFRGAALDKITDEEATYMEDTLGIRYILDYRDEEEANLTPDYHFSKASYERISALHIDDQEGFDFGNMMSDGMTVDKLKAMLEYLQLGYKYMPFNNDAYKRLFEILLEDNGHIYFHCSAGKDRTGISAFLIMMALGMSEEDGVKEYMKSNDYLKSYVANFYKEHPSAHLAKKYVDKLLFVQEENIRLVIKTMYEKYPSYEEYFEKELNVDQIKIAKLKKIYLD
ncbi:MAG: tyrosine-protein phosphatase [Erysipelotrichaceae bacterium]|nr:tyrosine-protein phosphatase [Erysipelotrichaceae bacterium]